MVVRIAAVVFALGLLPFTAGAAVAARSARSPSGAVMALEPEVQARAKQIVISPRDLPRGWVVDGSWASRETATTGPGWSCSGHTADLSSLVVRGAWSAQNKHQGPSGRASLVTSFVFVLDRPQQAERLFDISRTYYSKYCAVFGTVRNGWALLPLTKLSLPPVTADQMVGLRSVAAYATETRWGDFILIRKGAVLGTLEFSSPQKAFPPDLEAAVIKTFVARLHR